MKNTKITFRFILILVSLVSLFLSSGFAPVIPGTAGTFDTVTESTVTSSLPTISNFVRTLTTSSAETVSGVYIPSEFAFNVTQQPAGNAGFVSSEENLITQFGLASKYGSTGLIAHNHLAGATFSDVTPGQTVVVVNGDGTLDYYHIFAVEKYQALSPYSPYSQFLNLDNSGQTLTSTELFMHIYAQPGQLVLQTCIAQGDEPSWGRLFILAEPIEAFGPQT